MISCGAIRPPPFFFNRVWEITARIDSDNIERTMSFSAPENVDDTVDGFGGRGRMQSPKHQMPGFGRG